ncbi:MAG TPA: enoyl-CoA hydratase-related protein [Polyangiaceae bacterium]
MSASQFETVSVQRTADIVTVSLERLTMPPQMFRELGSLFRSFAQDPALRAVVLRSAVQHFTYGLDLAVTFSEHGVSGGGASEGLALHHSICSLQDDIGAVAACPVKVVAAVHGRCIGGGIDLISACDVRLASVDAKFSVPETKADLGTLERLPALIGQAHTRELASTRQDISAARAQQIGLINDVYGDRSALDAAAEALAREIAANPLGATNKPYASAPCAHSA